MAFYFTKSMLKNLNKAGYPVTYFSNPELSNDSSVDGKMWALFEKKEDLDLSKEMICRVCAKNGCTPLTDSLENGFDIMSALCSITNISMDIKDPLPNFICTECVMSLRVAFTLRKTAEASDIRFKRILSEKGYTQVNYYPHSKHDFNLILHTMKMQRRKLEEDVNNFKVKRRKQDKKVSTPRDKKKQFRCSACDLTFNDKESLRAHCRHRRCAYRACDVCGQLVASVALHRRTAHAHAPPHQCPTCGKAFPILARLKSHMLVHTDTFNFFCDLCPYKCKQKYYLVMHMRTHTGEKPYKCPFCPATFVNPSNLNKHKLTHEEKQFKCALCAKSFRTNPMLREHCEAAHLNIKRTCNLCGRNFRYRTDLRKHEIRVHNRTKREYVGGEPAYRQLERLQREQSEHAKCQKEEMIEVAPAYYEPDESKQFILFTEVTPQMQADIIQQAVVMPGESESHLVNRVPTIPKEDKSMYENQQQTLDFF